MIALPKALLLTALQLALLMALGGKLLLDRATRPRCWVRAAPVDPDLPIRGRYVQLRAELPLAGSPRTARTPAYAQVRLVLDGQTLKAEPAERPTAVGAILRPAGAQGSWVADLQEPLAFFLPEHVPDPSRRAPGEELWVEVTLPRQGPLRPIRLAVKRDGVLTAISH